MNLSRPPSLQREYDTYFSGDSALVAPPDSSDEQARKDYDAKLEVALDTGDWSALMLEGKTPTKFTLLQVDRNIWRSIWDRRVLSPDNPRYIGEVVLPALLLRLALKSIAGWDAIKRAPDPAWDGWVMAPAEVVTMLDSIGPAVVTQLGTGIWFKLNGGVSKKS